MNEFTHTAFDFLGDIGIISLDFYPYDINGLQSFYCGPNITWASECIPYTETDISLESTYREQTLYMDDEVNLLIENLPSWQTAMNYLNRNNTLSVRFNVTGAGVKVAVSPNSGLIFKSGFVYNSRIPKITLQHYNPLPVQARLYFCSYGKFNVLSHTLAMTYSTATPVLSVLLGILIIIALFEIRYIYGQDVQQLYYQDIEINDQQKQDLNSNSDPFDTIGLESKADSVRTFISGSEDRVFSGE